MEVLEQAGFMENRARAAKAVKYCRGQSVAEYAVVLALILIIAVTVLMGVGQRSRTRLANVDTLLSDHPGGAAGGSAGAAAGASHVGSGDNDNSESGSATNQQHGGSAAK
ncbi:MAG TPA: hypothetical protein VL486_08890 [Verrucomicrobiae bacterium]|nr:hypothetical protein [Verrucomicrobiae bacterium]